ncbi:hypothetical protein LCGC14_2127030 [marine sediment metagenome]|uniref:Uncharacterized protein n=1 Tax=marine sediment metagenome TaxID=412755 RepID=A0A0F9EPP0_9ZZZZ
MKERYEKAHTKVKDMPSEDLIGKDVKILVGKFKDKVVKIEKIEYDKKEKKHRILTYDKNKKVGGAIEQIAEPTVDKEGYHVCPECGTRLSKIYEDKRYYMEDMIKVI